MSVSEAGEGAGQVRVFAQYTRDFEDEADVLVVGSGPCGSVVAHQVAKAGRRVILVEEGPPFTPADFALEGSRSMARTMREGGLRSTRGTVLPTMQAIALGGGSLVNSAICVRPPDSVFDRWATGFDLAITNRAELDRHYDQVGEFLGIAPTPEEVLGPRNTLFRDGCDALGYSSEPISRNVRNCRGSGECFTGCRNRAKQSMDISYVPDAIRHGARVLTSLQVQELQHDGSRVTGVTGQVAEPLTGRLSHRFKLRAKIVVLAAGCMATPVLLQKSGNLANRSRQVGENLQFHPGVAIAGFFPDATRPQFGATQGYQSLHFLEQGFKLETLWAPPAVMAVRMPGFGHPLQEIFASFPKMAVFDAIASTNRSLGTVRPRRRGLDPVLTWQLHPEDVQIIVHSLQVLTDIFFAAGADRVVPGVNGVPDVFYSRDEADVLRTRAIAATDLVCGGNHAFCTTRMHGDSARGVVDEYGRCHDLDNLYIADTGVFPQCPSVNPMFTGMAMAHRQGEQLVERL